MFALFRRRQKAAGFDNNSGADTSKGLLQPASVAELMASPRRRILLEHIWQRTSLSRAQFDALYRAPIDRYALLVQQFPASENHHHAYPGGMLDHGLEIVAFALKLRQSHLLPVGAASETQAAQAEAWTAGAAYAALLHDVGKIAVDLYVEYEDGAPWHPWHGPVQRPYRFRYRKDREYRLHGAAAGLLYTTILDSTILDWLSGFPELWPPLLYILAGQHEHAGVLGELVMQADQASVAQDLGGDPTSARTAPRHALQRKLLDGLRYLLKKELKLNQPQASDGWLTQDALWLVSKTVCDKLRAHLLSHGIDGIPERNTAVFNVLQDHGIVLATSDGNAIWKATVTSDSGWSHSFTFLRLAPAMIWGNGERPAAFSGTVRIEGTNTPSTNPPMSNETPLSPVRTESAAQVAGEPQTVSAPSSDDLDNVLALLADEGSSRGHTEARDSPANTATTALSPRDIDSGTEPSSDSLIPPELPGAHFMTWLRTAIQSRRLVINDAKALVHTVSGTAYLVSPGIFRRYVQEHPHVTSRAHRGGARDWVWVQKHFERLKVHKKHSSGLNIWTCEVTGARRTRRLHGYLLSNGSELFTEIPFDNPFLKLLSAAASGDEAAD